MKPSGKYSASTKREVSSAIFWKGAGLSGLRHASSFEVMINLIYNQFDKEHTIM